MQPLRFGTATSSYQIEGAVGVDGRGPSIWDTFCARPGTIVDGSDGAVACDSYHRLDDDLTLLEDLGVTAYRFSIAWPRVQPTGRGAALAAGLDYYERLVDGLLAKGIRPFPTLYHWDLPQALEDGGGWPVRSTAEAFVDYTAQVVGRLADRVTDWATLNEPWCTAFLGYSAGIHAPGRREPEAAFATAHHLLLAHAWGAQVIREHGGNAGIVLNLSPVWDEGDADPLAIAMVDAVQNGIWTQPLSQGTYPEVLLERSPALTTTVQDGDLALIQASVDWVGVNYYSGYRLGKGYDGAEPAYDTAHPYTPSASWHSREPKTEMGWEVVPEGMTEIMLTAARCFPGLPLRVTENGAAMPDQRVEDGVVLDDDRVDYLRRHIEAVEAARAAGAPVVDYFAWSLLDNFEWAEGYTKNFGIVAVDDKTQDRTPKKSFHWYADRVRQ